MLQPEVSSVDQRWSWQSVFLRASTYFEVLQIGKSTFRGWRPKMFDHNCHLWFRDTRKTSVTFMTHMHKLKEKVLFFLGWCRIWSVERWYQYEVGIQESLPPFCLLPKTGPHTNTKVQLQLSDLLGSHLQHKEMPK